MRGLEAAVWTVFDRRLRRSGPPIAVALSGGGDSLALTLIADRWARDRARELVILYVDHRLRPEGAEWGVRCGAIAARLGRTFQALAWDGDKPATGLPAAARQARHRLLAEAARTAGAQVILMGHTADDLAEAKVMRSAGSTTPDPREWAPSPVWPEGRGVFVLRPLLGRRRGDLRRWLTDRGETWIDDPANDDLRFARARARAAGAGVVDAREDDVPFELAQVVDHSWGAIEIPRDALRRATIEDVVRLVGLACVCAGGGDRRPATARLQRIARLLQADEPVAATLAGARISATAKEVTIGREPGEFRRRPLPPLELRTGRETIWDGRFAATAHRPGMALLPLPGLAARLPRGDRSFLSAIQPTIRAGLPAVAPPDGQVRLPVRPDLANDLTIEPLVRARFEAAAGLVQREP